MIERMLFTLAQAAKLSGLSSSTLRRWDERGLYPPEHGHDDGTWFYSFRDLVGLRAVARLRREYGVSMPQIESVAQRLNQHSSARELWPKLTLYAVGNRVFFEDPITGQLMAAIPPGQLVMPLPMERVAAEMREAVERMRRRDASQIGQFTRRPGVAGGEWVFSGTRIPLSAVWDFLDAGYSAADIVGEYPALTIADVEAAAARKRDVARAS